MAFTVQDIMMSENRLLKAADEASARQILARQQDFDIIPICKNGEILRYMQRGSAVGKVIVITEAIAETTPLLDLVDVLVTRPFCFIQSNNRVIGYVHFSDLNNSLVKYPFEMLAEALGRQILGFFETQLNEDTLTKIVGTKRWTAIQERAALDRRNRSDLGLANYLTFGEILMAAKHFNLVEISGAEMETIKPLRALAEHTTEILIPDYQAVKNLAAAKAVCMGLLQKVSTT